ncbi:MAG: NFACT family protein [Lachnospiraceae bacterium]|nr:NFACT family protein [Lachnospiraceae bacterium]
MAFDGFTVSALVKEIKEKLVGGRINKIAQPEKDELIITVKNYDNYRLDISVSPSLPLLRFTDENKPSPAAAPAFCMLLRKHIGSARILDVDQPGLERVVRIRLEHLDEMGDLRQKWLMIELMGKHSNIIFTDEELKVLDSIKRIPSSVSSVREVLPGRDYFIPKTDDKLEIERFSIAGFASALKKHRCDIHKALYSSFTGFSPLLSSEICFRAGVNPSLNTEELGDNEAESLYEICMLFLNKVKTGDYEPYIIYKGSTAVEYAAFRLLSYENEDYTREKYESMSLLLGSFYSMKEKQSRISQKSQALRKSLSNAIERTSKKIDLQLTQLKSTEKRDKYKVYGELVSTYGYTVEEGSKSMSCTNYYDGNEITIPLDDTIPVMANAKRYFDRYAKLKRTFEAVTKQLKNSREELYHLQSIQNSMDHALNDDDLNQIRRELEEYGYVRRTSSAASKGKQNPRNQKGPKSSSKSLPFHYRTPEGYDIYVGRNNYQNDELSFKMSNGSDWWFHSKTIPGSHVILKNKGEEIPDKEFEYAAAAAAYYSSDKSGGKIEIDYLERRNLKKPAGSKPGFVVYYTNYSMVAAPGLEGLTEIKD